MLSSVNNTILYALLMLLAGLGIPIMAALNASLATKIESPALAISILFLVGGVISLGYLFISGGMPKLTHVEPVPVYLYLSVFLLIFYLLSITWVVPKFGVGNAVSFVLLGQLVSMAVIDHYGLLSAPQNTLSITRLIGLALMVIGVFMVVHVSSAIKVQV